MGICLDTEQTNEVEEEATGSRTWATSGRGVATPPAGKFPMQNSSHVKFESPKVPVIFVLGGPGSGKVTHCDNLMQEKRGIVHINITDLLQQYAIGNDMQDFGTLSSKTVTEVLMLEMKMSPTAKTYLVSGYPRSMRDVAEYSDKIQVVNGVILVSWRQKVLERQIDYGAKLGHVVLSLAKMELKNFYKNVMPVADYFDQSNMLIAVNGERNPGEVYKDFRDAVLQILNSVEADASGEATDAAPALRPPVPAPVLLSAPHRADPVVANIYDDKPEPIQVRAAANGRQPPRPGHVPPVIWVIGGPGSNKAALCQRAIAQAPGWAHFSFGLRLRSLADTAGQAGSDASVTRATLGGGELVPADLVRRVLREAVVQHADARGLLMDGFPRDLEQVEYFEQEYKQQPNLILLDCSKLQLGRGRRDDSVAAFRRRLELFRELSLPMLKSLDAARRLFIVDGDTDTAPVRAEFEQLLLEQARQAEALRESLSAHGEVRYDSPDVYDHEAAQAANNHNNNNTGLNTISQQVALAAHRMGNGLAHNGVAHNGVAHNGVAHNGVVHNGVANGNYANGNVVNGFIGMATAKVKPITNSVQPKAIPTHGHLDRDSLMNLYQRNGDMETHM